mmetsp:Transcript_8664/g.26278  ORF Transcript_8664/g.26278 Transcript_8664/m.26278 type:complete len:172 (-) Transcript_8664:695-1210(-)|eukprot:360591-Chlamydomonas_euryale.AAC.19
MSQPSPTTAGYWLPLGTGVGMGLGTGKGLGTGLGTGLGIGLGVVGGTMMDSQVSCTPSMQRRFTLNTGVSTGPTASPSAAILHVPTVSAAMQSSGTDCGATGSMSWQRTGTRAAAQAQQFDTLVLSMRKSGRLTLMAAAQVELQQPSRRPRSDRHATRFCVAEAMHSDEMP